MTDPTPTRAEVEALCAELRGYQAMMQDNLGGRSADMIQALRERAEAAEELLAHMMQVQRCTVDAANEARRAEAAAWNDAIEAAAEACTTVIKDYDVMTPCGNKYEPIKVQKAAKGMVSLARQDIRALRRAAPTEGEA